MRKFYKKLNARMMKHRRIFKSIALCTFTLIIAFILLLANTLPVNLPALQPKDAETIKWVDFDVPYKVLEKAMYLDIHSWQSEVHLDWIETLAYLAGKYGGNFKNYKAKDMDSLAEKRNNGQSIEELTKDMKYYDYYLKAYTAILGGFLGEYKIQVPVEAENEDGVETDGDIVWQEKYGLKAFSPIAQGYWYNDYDDFGSKRSYGYDRKHFGHDLMISTGTPIIAVESGIVEALGWNQYGGWRIGIRSFDKQRYYYYAHLRKDRPYAAGLYVGKAVKAGDVIGYSGRTGYSVKENVNNIDTPHLHIGMQLIFDEALKDSPNQIWIDLYSITRLLSKNKSPVYKDEETKEYYRKYDFSEPSYYQENAPAEEPFERDFTIVTAATAPEGSIPLPIIMYHGIVNKPPRDNKFFISTTTFENDLKYLKENGYTAVFMRDLIAYVTEGTPLPEKPIILTFDDGYYNNYLYAYPLLQQYNTKGVISILGSVTDKFSELEEDNPLYAYLTWDQINEMIQSGYVEIQNHTYNMHSSGGVRKGVMKTSSESHEQYSLALQDDIGYLQNRIQKMTGTTPNTFTYPFGFVTDDSKTILLNDMGFKATLTCYEGVNYIEKDPDDLYRLKRILRGPNKSSEDFFKTIAPARTEL